MEESYYPARHIKYFILAIRAEGTGFLRYEIQPCTLCWQCFSEPLYCSVCAFNVIGVTRLRCINVIISDFDELSDKNRMLR